MNRGPQDDKFDKEPRGRIPESLIDAALDGEICDQMQDEIAHALRYDHHRRAELLETADAVRALDLDDIPMPDMQCAVLNRLDTHDRFIPRSMRRWVRTGRMAVAAGVLLGLMVVAGLQSMYPRLTTLGTQSTPVHDVAIAVEEDTYQVAQDVQSQVARVRASISPLEGLLSSSGNHQRAITAGSKSFVLTINDRVVRLSEADLAALYECGVEGLGGSQNTAQIRWEQNSQHQSVSGVMTVSFATGYRAGVVGFPGEQAMLPATRVERETRSDERITDLP